MCDRKEEASQRTHALILYKGQTGKTRQLLKEKVNVAKKRIVIIFLKVGYHGFAMAAVSTAACYL